MFLETLTFGMFALVLVLKYGAVKRIMRLNQRLRDAEHKCRKHKDNLKQFRFERLVAERDEAGLERQRTSLETELQKLNEALENLKDENAEVMQELLKKNARVSPDLRDETDPEKCSEDYV